MAWTLCTSGAAILKAGTNANSTITASGASLAVWSLEAEGRIEQETHTSWVTNYSTLSTGMQGALAQVCSALVAQSIISYDTTGYLSREADTLLNKNDDEITKGLAALSDKTKHTLRSP